MADRRAATGSNASRLGPISIPHASCGPRKCNRNSQILIANPSLPRRANISRFLRSHCAVRGGTVNRPRTHLTYRKQRIGCDQGRNFPVHFKSCRAFAVFRVAWSGTAAKTARRGHIASHIANYIEEAENAGGCSPPSCTSSVTTVNWRKSAVPNDVVIATSDASSPTAINTRPMRG